MNIFVIGNGFDQHHGLPTSYGCFENFVRTRHPDAHLLFQHLFPVDTIRHWKDFETAFGEITFDRYKRAFQERYGSLPSTDAITSMQSTEFADYIGQFFGLRQNHVSPNSPNLFSEWIDTIDLSAVQAQFFFPENSWFITFNYTETLQQVYGLQEPGVYHIHGKRGDPDNKIVVGHGLNVESVATDIDAPSENNPSNPWYQLYREAQKPVHGRMGINRSLDAKIRSIFRDLIGNNTSSVNIFVFGHSLSEVDKPYFETLVKHLPHASWRFSYFGGADCAAGMKAKISKLSICERQVVALKPLEDFEQDLFVSGVD